MLAGVGTGLFPDLAAAQSMWRAERRFEPSIDARERSARKAVWARAVGQVMAGLSQ